MGIAAGFPGRGAERSRPPTESAAASRVEGIQAAAGPPSGVALVTRFPLDYLLSTASVPSRSGDTGSDTLAAPQARARGWGLGGGGRRGVVVVGPGSEYLPGPAALRTRESLTSFIERVRDKSKYTRAAVRERLQRDQGCARSWLP